MACIAPKEYDEEQAALQAEMGLTPMLLPGALGLRHPRPVKV